MIALRGAALVTIVAAASAAMQYQVNTQRNSELYGRGVGTVRRSNLPTYQASLRSDTRHDMFLSGALRSDVRGQYGATGPLAPSGATSYIPSVARPYGRLGSPSGGAQSGGYSRSWQPRSSVGPAVGGSAYRGYGYGSASSVGSVRYSSYAARPAGVPLPGPMTTTGQPSPFSVRPAGSARYGY